MKNSIAFSIEDVGQVSVEHSTRARRMIISVSPAGIRVAVPRGVALERGRAFALARKDWIRHHVGRLRTKLKAQAALSIGLPPMENGAAARKMIVERLKDLSAMHGLPYAGVSVRNQKTRWGSCSACHNISLNINLARLPGKLMDYVIVHELLHTKIRGHGRDFWKGLDSLLGDAKRLRDALRNYSLALMQQDMEDV